MIENLLLKRKIVETSIILYPKPSLEELKKINGGFNMIFVPPDANKPVVFVLINYKTAKIFKAHVKPFSSPLSKMIRQYIDDRSTTDDAKNDGTLFGKKKMSTWVGETLLKAGIKKKKGNADYDPTQNKGSVTLLRKAFVSKELKTVTTYEERETLAYAMKHAPEVSLKYVRDEIVPTIESGDNESELSKVKYSATE